MCLSLWQFAQIKTQAEAASRKLAEEYGEPIWCKGTGMRNTHLIAIAPTVSNSTISGGVSAGIEPIPANVYTFNSSTGASEIIAYEGKVTNKTFIVGATTDRQVYVIPDKNIDVKTASVTVYNSTTSASYETYTELDRAATVDSTSTYYTIRETPNGFYEINFGDGVTFGKSPTAGNKIVVSYLSTAGEAGNGGIAFTANNQISILGTSYPVNVIPLSKSISGSNLQSIDTIKQLAPVAFSTQQRLVTALDYESMIKANFPAIQSVAAWGSQDNIPVDYGCVYISLDYGSGVTEEEKINIKIIRQVLPL